MAKKITRRAGQKLRDELALLDALEPIEDELHAAKDAYRAAIESGDPQAIRAAALRKDAAAHHINETRTWLRRERSIVKVTETVTTLQEALSRPVLDETGEESPELRAEYVATLAAAQVELEELAVAAEQTRRDLAALGAVTPATPSAGVPAGAAGDAEVSMSPVGVRTTTNGTKKGGGR
ncbi:hypothetical protein ACFY19_20690 [Streptosporangium saharense]|uniref:hypothetical protein n=1 Tax=Streptosporangium saharense TaxID=1706840 RepID=UPI003681F02F